jgi:hypothetical protein
MKKKQVVLWMSIALLLLSSPVYSQIKLGFQLGPNFANGNITSNSSFTFSIYPWEIEGKTHFFGGILAEFTISDMFYIQPEVNFLPKGVISKGTPLYSSKYTPDKFDNIFNYFEIPINVLAKFNLSNFTPFIFAGPSLSFLLEAKATLGSFGTDLSSEEFKKTDFSINLGGGVEFPINSVNLFVMARYSLGLTNIMNKKVPFLYNGWEKLNTRNLSFSTGLKFSI